MHFHNSSLFEIPEAMTPNYGTLPHYGHLHLEKIIIICADRVQADVARGSQALQRCIAAAGPQIMAALLLSLLGPSPLVRVHKAACILAGLVRLPGSHPQAACQWLEAALTLYGECSLPKFYWQVIDG